MNAALRAVAGVGLIGAGAVAHVASVLLGRVGEALKRIEDRKRYRDPGYVRVLKVRRPDAVAVRVLRRL